MLSAPTLTRLASLAAFLNTAPGLRGGQPADERFTACLLYTSDAADDQSTV